MYRAASRLRDTRLGKLERHHLLAAAAPDGLAQPILPRGPAPSQQTATRRAVAKLERAGLIKVAEEKRRVTPDTDRQLLRTLGRKYAVVRFAWRTPLGEEVVRMYRPELEGGKRIRWMFHLDEACRAALAKCPHRQADRQTHHKGSQDNG